MKAECEGSDYFLYLEREQNDWEQLRHSPLSSPLTGRFGYPDLGKMITLQYGETKDPNGIEYMQLASDAAGGLPEVMVTINDRVYYAIHDRRAVRVKYSVTDTIKITDGLQDEPVF